VVDEPTGPAPIQPLQSGGVRRSLYLGILAILQSGLVAAWILKKTGVSTSLISVDDLQAVWGLLTFAYSAVVAAYVGIRTFLKRYRAGQDPANPAPPIAAPKLMQRLTNGG
jgi:hypothetical protein